MLNLCFNDLLRPIQTQCNQVSYCDLLSTLPVQDEGWGGKKGKKIIQTMIVILGPVVFTAYFDMNGFKVQAGT